MPEEIAILGIGNDAFLCENQTVPLSSVDDELERNGSEAAALLERLMDGRRAPPMRNSSAAASRGPGT